ncbi:uncharacterized protein LOC104432874 [Eucalyptus grandis]|uniref:Transmembrane protein n=2 Tax=Eucalyptus grandis TaxID=71139 RepID=A0A059D5N4_EUCGR|nr:uncharacterized protein LOC104432874 [Eucalyptus grandis]KAK3442298.1 hypothetical protein EUGRSUZ_B02498 [Eucalyptus grandis]
MTPMSSFLLILLTPTFLCLAGAQDRAPHGLANENPMAFSPSAYDFFHPNTQQTTVKNPCAISSCSPLPEAAQVVGAAQGQDGKLSATRDGKSQMGVGGIVGIVFALAFAVLLAMGVYYVVVTRRANASKAKAIQPDTGCAQSV